MEWSRGRCKGLHRVQSGAEDPLRDEATGPDRYDVGIYISRPEAKPRWQHMRAMAFSGPRGTQMTQAFSLPPDLRAAFEVALHEKSRAALSTESRNLSRRYRSPDLTAAPLQYSADDALAYVGYRLPATFAAISAVVSEACDRQPTLSPVSLLDVGAGPGTGAWAAAQFWPSLDTITLVDRNSHMVDLGRRMAVTARFPTMRGATWLQEPLNENMQLPTADVTLAAYVLGELPAHQRGGFVRLLWEHADNLCILLEPGTPAGFTRIREATSVLAATGANILAPFPPAWSCLEHADDWTHFSVRLPRTRTQRSAKSAELAYEDEKFCYVIASTGPGIPIAARVLRHPQVRTGHIRLVLGTESGVQHLVVAKSNKAAYRRARDLKWGDALPIEDAALFRLV